jgi:hypothetical protein
MMQAQAHHAKACPKTLLNMMVRPSTSPERAES